MDFSAQCQITYEADIETGIYYQIELQIETFGDIKDLNNKYYYNFLLYSFLKTCFFIFLLKYCRL